MLVLGLRLRSGQEQDWDRNGSRIEGMVGGGGVGGGGGGGVTSIHGVWGGIWGGLVGLYISLGRKGTWVGR